MDSVILVHNIIYSLKITCTLGMLLKLYISKDFDKLRWQYMKAILKAFGFNKDWIFWIMNLIFSTLF
jgi:hypothetical protein